MKNFIVTSTKLLITSFLEKKKIICAFRFDKLRTKRSIKRLTNTIVVDYLHTSGMIKGF